MIVGSESKKENVLTLLLVRLGKEFWYRQINGLRVNFAWESRKVGGTFFK